MDSATLTVEDEFKILVASDIHLGYEEKNLIRADDSFNTFKEVLQLANKHNVDFILLGGDLFHANQPSVSCIDRCISLLRTYCMGDKPISIEFASDQAEIFKHCNLPIVNYEDQNLNISIPVFSIHGNHDDPTGYKEKSSLDILSSSGLVNYFGKQTNLEQLKIYPILLKKGASKIALYGLSHIRDERLERLFRNRNVRMFRPLEDQEQWLNIFVCHQNRVKRPGTKHLPEEYIPDYIDLTIWGHEHESLIVPNETKGRGLICQPGSTVATSMCEGESGKKHAGLLTVKGKEFKMEPLELKTVRPIHFETIKLSECDEDVDSSEKAQEFIRNKIEDILSSVKFTGHFEQPKLPLIRLRVEYTSDVQHFSAVQLGREFQDRVANFNDMVMLKMEKKNTHQKPNFIDDDTFSNIVDNQEIEKIEQIVNEYFKNACDGDKLELLSVRGMSEAVDAIVNKASDRSDAIACVVKHQMNKVKDYVMKQEDLNENNLLEYINMYHIYRSQLPTNKSNEIHNMMSSQLFTQTQPTNSHHNSDELPNKQDDEQVNISTNTDCRGRGRRGAKAASRPKTRGRAKGQTTLPF